MTCIISTFPHVHIYQVSLFILGSRFQWTDGQTDGNIDGGQTYSTCLAAYIAHSVTCLVADTCLTAYPGIGSSILARSHTFVEIDHEIISTTILLPSADSIRVVVS